MRPLRIAYFTDGYHPRMSGVATAIDTYRAGLAAKGHSSIVVAPNYPGVERNARPDVLRLRSAPAPVASKEDRFAWPFSRTVYKTLDTFRPDLVHTQSEFTVGWAGLRYAATRRIPVMHTYHTLWQEFVHYARFLPEAFSKRRAASLSRVFCNRTRLVITPSGPIRDVLLGYGVATRIVVLPTGMPLTKFVAGNRTRFRRTHRIAPRAPLALYMGRISGEKNLDFLLRAFALLKADMPSARLAIAGDGPAREGLINAAAQFGFGEPVVFPGYLRGQRWADAYAAADVFSFASLSETQGLVLTEAMAYGLPVVAVGAMGVLDVLKSGRGGIATGPDPIAFFRALKRVLSDRRLHARLSREARAKAQEWSSERTNQKLQTLYSSLTLPKSKVA